MNKGTGMTSIQYGSVATAITSLTGNLELFFTQLHKAAYQSQGKSLLIAPFVASNAQLSVDRNRAIGTIVIFVDGRSNFGSDPSLNSNSFRRTGEALLGICVGSLYKEGPEVVVQSDIEIQPLCHYSQISGILEKLVSETCFRKDT